MWQTEIQINNRDVIDNGVVITYGNDPIQLTLKPDIKNSEAADLALSFVIRFDDNGEEPDLESRFLGENEVEFTLLNHRRGATIGGTTPIIGSIEPLNLGILGNRELTFGYNVNSRISNEGEPLVTHFFYNLYLKNENQEKEEMEEEDVSEK